MRASDHKIAIRCAVALLTLTAVPLAARADDDTEAKLRAELRSATIQLRQLQDQNADLQAKQAQDQREKLALTQKLAADEDELTQLRQQNQAAQTSAQQLTQKLQAANGAIAAEHNDLNKLQANYQQTVQAAQARDAEATRIEATLVETRKRLFTCADDNVALYDLGTQILDLYDHKGVLGTLASNEPITRLKRVQLENLVQDYQDKMLDKKYDLTAPADKPAAADTKPAASDDKAAPPAK